MAVSLPYLPVPEVYTAAEVASAAAVPVRKVRHLVNTGKVYSENGFIPQPDAVRLVRALTGQAQLTEADRMPITLMPRTRRQGGGLSLATSTGLHAALALLLGLASSLGWLAARDTEIVVPRDTPARLVFLNLPGPGGGGGGGGLTMPSPPPQAERKAPQPKKLVSPVPPVRRTAAPPRPTPRPRRPPVVTPPVRPQREAPLPSLAAPQAIQAPVMPIASGEIELAGLPEAPPTPAEDFSSGPGSGGGIGAGNGAGLGEGDGGGIGQGSGGGTGGGPYQPGSGIEPPVLVREVRASYTTEARRRALEGDVVLEVVVGREGRVTSARVLQGLGAGLDERALDAVRQWRFTPARRQGVPVDVVVTVSVEFTLR
jgi:TonB family protein